MPLPNKPWLSAERQPVRLLHPVSALQPLNVGLAVLLTIIAPIRLLAQSIGGVFRKSAGVDSVAIALTLG
jgi:hypothetical protein